ncbi:MAG: hypothetical protein KME07_07120 [Pegethrix bostrychoides GSE-TBD4-15B]|jgi:hypothetical protein|uniref:Uncharacterized protein n=1 Tax=Pegethrix bostrychoides GSE-TBD4-15B TaxID=2839662 RepID=A0A951P9D4_9CYAN|nr:hypothetical protein [Pegethrix bostrychoides GSE-TBD4-15B]
MQLSVYEQYCIRKLLRCYLSRLNYPTFGVAACNYFQSDLNQIMKQLYPNDFRNKIQDLRGLIGLHAAAGERKLNGLEQIEIERRLLWLLGLKFLVLIDNISMPIISESAAIHFNFLWDGGVHRGIRQANELYRLCFSFAPEPDALSYRMLLTGVSHHVPLILTVSQYHHIVWISLRSHTDYLSGLNLFESIPIQKVQSVLKIVA